MDEFIPLENLQATKSTEAIFLDRYSSKQEQRTARQQLVSSHRLFFLNNPIAEQSYSAHHTFAAQGTSCHSFTFTSLEVPKIFLCF